MPAHAVDLTQKLTAIFAAGVLLGGASMFMAMLWFFCFRVPPAQIRAELLQLRVRRSDRRIARRD